MITIKKDVAELVEILFKNINTKSYYIKQIRENCSQIDFEQLDHQTISDLNDTFEKTLNDCNIDMFKRVLSMYFTLNTLNESNHESKWEKMLKKLTTEFRRLTINSHQNWSSITNVFSSTKQLVKNDLDERLAFKIIYRFAIFVRDSFRIENGTPAANDNEPTSRQTEQYELKKIQYLSRLLGNFYKNCSCSSVRKMILDNFVSPEKLAKVNKSKIDMVLTLFDRSNLQHFLNNHKYSSSSSKSSHQNGNNNSSNNKRAYSFGDINFKSMKLNLNLRKRKLAEETINTIENKKKDDQTSPKKKLKKTNDLGLEISYATEYSDCGSTNDDHEMSPNQDQDCGSVCESLTQSATIAVESVKNLVNQSLGSQSNQTAVCSDAVSEPSRSQSTVLSVRILNKPTNERTIKSIIDTHVDAGVNVNVEANDQNDHKTVKEEDDEIIYIETVRKSSSPIPNDNNKILKYSQENASQTENCLDLPIEQIPKCSLPINNSTDDTSLDVIMLDNENTVENETMSPLEIFLSKNYHEDTAVINIHKLIINFLEMKSFNTFRNLLQLSIIDSDITCVDLAGFDASNVPNLQIISFKKNKIESLDKNTFVGMNKLTSIDFSYNNISVLDKDLFAPLPNLKSVIFSNNRIKYLTNDHFRANARLIELHFVTNSITFLHEETFAQLPCLRRLHFSHNQLRTLPVNLFKRLFNLTDLHFSSNQISALPNGLLWDLKNLTNLNMASNKITELDEDVFRGCVQLKNLILSYNQITNIPKQMFAFTPNLLMVNLNSNKLTEFNRDLFILCKNMKQVLVASNCIRSCCYRNRFNQTFQIDYSKNPCYLKD